MSNLHVLGAGTIAINDYYINSGILNGQPYYISNSGNYIVYYNTGSLFYSLNNNSSGSPGTSIYYTCAAGTNPTASWTSVLGSAPAPTVSFISSSSSSKSSSRSSSSRSSSSETFIPNNVWVTAAVNTNLANYSLNNGLTWNSATLPSTHTWIPIASGGGKFVLLATDSSAVGCYSTDGIHWTGMTTQATNRWGTLAYGNGTFVVLSDDGTANNGNYSTDGITWTAITTLPVLTSASWGGLSYGNGKFVALAGGVSWDTGAYSTDGITWNTMTMPSNSSWNSVAYGNGVWAALNQTGTTAAYSTDGITWTATTCPSLGTTLQRCLTFGNGRFVATDINTRNTITSTDGITWTAHSGVLPSTSGFWDAISFGNGVFIITARNATDTAYSIDGITWTNGGALTNGSDQWIALKELTYFTSSKSSSSSSKSSRSSSSSSSSKSSRSSSKSSSSSSKSSHSSRSSSSSATNNGIHIPIKTKSTFSIGGQNLDCSITYFNHTLVPNVSINTNYVHCNQTLNIGGVPLALGNYGANYALLCYNQMSIANSTGFVNFWGQNFNTSLYNGYNVLPVKVLYNQTKAKNLFEFRGIPLATDANNCLIINTVTGVPQEFTHVTIGGVPLRVVQIGYSYYICISEIF